MSEKSPDLASQKTSPSDQKIGGVQREKPAAVITDSTPHDDDLICLEDAESTSNPPVPETSAQESNNEYPDIIENADRQSKSEFGKGQDDTSIREFNSIGISTQCTAGGKSEWSHTGDDEDFSTTNETKNITTANDSNEVSPKSPGANSNLAVKGTEFIQRDRMPKRDETEESLPITEKRRDSHSEGSDSRQNENFSVENNTQSQSPELKDCRKAKTNVIVIAKESGSTVHRTSQTELSITEDCQRAKLEDAVRWGQKSTCVKMCSDQPVHIGCFAASNSNIYEDCKQRNNGYMCCFRLPKVVHVSKRPRRRRKRSSRPRFRHFRRQTRLMQTEVKESREDEMKLFIVGVLQICAGAISIPLGIANFYIQMISDGDNPLPSGIWCGIVFILTGAQAVITSRYPSRVKAIVGLVLSILSSLSSISVEVMELISAIRQSGCHLTSQQVETRDAALLCVETVLALHVTLCGVVFTEMIISSLHTFYGFKVAKHEKRRKGVKLLKQSEQLELMAKYATT